MPNLFFIKGKSSFWGFLPLLFLLAWESQHYYDSQRFYNVKPVPQRRLERRFYRPSMLSKSVYGFYPFWVYNWGYTPSRWDLVSRLAYFSCEIDSLGNVINRRGWCPVDLLDEAHSHNVPLDVVITLFDTDGSRIHYLLSDSLNRANLIDNIGQLLLDYGEGVNIDFELPTSGDSLYLVDFFRELKASCDPRYSISLDLPPVDWRDAFKLDSLASYVDFFFLMAYGYYGPYSSVTGPIAPFDDPTETYDVTNSVENTLAGLDGVGEQVILGQPLYGYQWECDGSERGANTLAVGVPLFYYEAAESVGVYGRLWDELSSTPWYRYSGSWHQAWYEDAEALSYGYGLVNDRDLMGTGFWALGYDDNRSEFWDGLQRAFSVAGTETVIVDDGDDNCTLTGSWAYSSSGGWDGGYYWTATTYQPDSALYYANLTEGRWSVYIWYRAGTNRASDTRVYVYHNGGTAEFIVDQRTNSAVWNYLGEFEFNGGTALRLVITDGGCEHGNVVVADGVMFIRMGDVVVVEGSRDNTGKASAFIYPNPTGRYIDVKGIANREAEIIDISGRLVKRVKFNGKQIDLGELRGGVYFLRVGERVVRFVKL